MSQSQDSLSEDRYHSPRSPTPRSHSHSRSRSRSPIRDDRERGRRHYPREDLEESRCVFIKNLPADISRDELFDFIGRQYKIEEIKIGIQRNTGLAYSFVTFETREDATSVYDSLKNANFQGNEIYVDWDVGRGKKRRSSRHGFRRGGPRRYGYRNDRYRSNRYRRSPGRRSPGRRSPGRRSPGRRSPMGRSMRRRSPIQTQPRRRSPSPRRYRRRSRSPPRY